MADTKSVFDMVDQDAEQRAIAKARAEIAAGKGVPHEKMPEWLAKGDAVPPPCTLEKRAAP
jgi:predicted transcriptional regulator